MANLTITRANYVSIQGWMVLDLELTGKELMVYAIIYGFSQSNMGKFTGSQNYLADWVGCSRQTINTILKTLVENNLIIKESYEKNGMTFCEYRANIKPIGFLGFDTLSNNLTPCNETSQKNIEKDISIQNNNEDTYNSPYNPPKQQTKKNAKKSLSVSEILEEVDKRSFSPAVREKLIEWFSYKEERKDPCKTIIGLNNLLTQLENRIKERGENAVLTRIDEAISREWMGWNFDTIDAFDKNRPYMQNKQQLDKKPRYKEFEKKPTVEGDKSVFQELRQNLNSMK